MIYYIILCLLVMSLFFTASSKKFLLFSGLLERCCIFFAILISATRVDIGLDYNSYLSQIRRFSANGDEGFFAGWSFNAFIQFISQINIISFTDSFRIIIAITSIITILATLYFIKTFSNPNLQKQALGLYLLIPLFYLSSFNVIRSSLSISIAYLAMAIFFKKKSLTSFILLLLIACTTHSIGIIFLITTLIVFILDKYIKKYITENPKIFTIVLIVSIFASLQIDTSTVTETLINIYSFFPFPDHYLISGFKEVYQGKGIGLISVLPLSILSAFLYLLLLNEKKERIKYIRAPLISCIFIPLIISSSGIITYAQYVRLMSPYLIFLMLTLIELINKLNYFRFFGAQIFIYTISVLYFLRNIYITGEINNLIPYNSWLLP